MKVSDILKIKGPEVYTIGEDKTLAEAVRILVNNRIGVLLVLNGEAKIIGILSERDIVAQLPGNPDKWKEMLVKEIMTTKVIVVESHDEIDYVESVMTDNHVRHLPVLKDKVLVGLISIGDIVKSQLKETRADIKYMMDYISGNIK